MITLQKAARGLQNRGIQHFGVLPERRQLFRKTSRGLQNGGIQHFGVLSERRQLFWKASRGLQNREILRLGVLLTLGLRRRFMESGHTPLCPEPGAVPKVNDLAIQSD